MCLRKPSGGRDAGRSTLELRYVLKNKSTAGHSQKASQWLYYSLKVIHSHTDMDEENRTRRNQVLLLKISIKSLKPPTCLLATVDGDGGFTGMLEKLSPTRFIGS